MIMRGQIHVIVVASVVFTLAGCSSVLVRCQTTGAPEDGVVGQVVRVEAPAPFREEEGLVRQGIILRNLNCQGSDIQRRVQIVLIRGGHSLMIQMKGRMGPLVLDERKLTPGTWVRIAPPGSDEWTPECRRLPWPLAMDDEELSCMATTISHLYICKNTPICQMEE